jgi:hypothetical protein
VQPDSVQHRNNCRLARQVIASGHPSPREEWALGVVWNCADAGPTLAAALSAARASTDTAYLNALTAPFIQLRDGTVFSAALSIAGDRAASVPARVAAVRTLMYAVRPGGYVDPAALPAADTRYCFGIPTPHSRIVNGASLPADYVAQVRALAHRIQNDPGESAGMRRAANCAMYSVRGR